MTGFRRRLIAISDGHTLLSEAEWKGASLKALVARGLLASSHGIRQEWQISGPEVTVAPRQTIALSLVMHELAANARTHGSLSAGGQVRVKWQPSNEEGKIDLIWRETNGSPVPGNQDKFGNVLIDLNVKYECEGTITRSYPPEGFTCTITLPWDPLSSRIAVAQGSARNGNFYRPET